MVTLAQVQVGLNKYIAQEFLSKMTGWKKWAFGAAVALMNQNVVAIFNMLKGNKYVSLMNIVDENDNIDIDKVYAAFKEQARQGAITEDLPVVGATTFTETDIEKLYSFIKRGNPYGT